MITFEDILSSMQDQVLAILTSWQEAGTEAVHAWVTAMSPLLPDLNIYSELPTIMQDALGNPEAIIESGYAFAIRVLELQREFVLEVFRASLISPRTPFVEAVEAA